MIGHRGLRLHPSIRDRMFRKLFTVHLRSAGSVYKGASLEAWQSVQWLFIEHLAQLLRPFAIVGIYATAGFSIPSSTKLRFRICIPRYILLASRLAKSYRVWVRVRVRVRVVFELKGKG